MPISKLFDEWAELNQVVSPDRSRFDALRKGFPLCRTRAEAEHLLYEEGYLGRYPDLPDWLK